jgi:hypothetical protein
MGNFSGYDVMRAEIDRVATTHAMLYATTSFVVPDRARFKKRPASKAGLFVHLAS